MNIEYKPQDHTYGEIRRHLLSRNYFIYRVILNLRQKMGLPPEGLGSFQNIFDWQAQQNTKLYKKYHNPKRWKFKSGVRKIKEFAETIFQVDQELYKPVFEAINKFSHIDLEFNLLTDFVLGMTDVRYNGSSKILRVTSAQNPITDVGVYIKYTPDLRDREFKKLKKEADEAYRILGYYYPALKKRKDQRKSNKVNQKNIDFYIAVEQALIDIYEKGKGAYLDLAQQQVSEQIDISATKLKIIHASIQKKYNLPSITEVSKI